MGVVIPGYLLGYSFALIAAVLALVLDLGEQALVHCSVLGCCEIKHPHFRRWALRSSREVNSLFHLTAAGVEGGG